MFKILEELDIDEVMDTIKDVVGAAEDAEMIEKTTFQLGNIGDSKEIGKSVMDFMKVMLDIFLIFLGSMFFIVAILPDTYTIPAFLSGLPIFLTGIIRIILRKRKRYILNKIATLVVSSELRAIADIVRHSKISEEKVIKNLRILVSGSTSLKLGNDARYLKGAKIDLRRMEVILSDKYVEKADWTCVYCRAVNEATAFVCQSCTAPKKNV